MAFSKKKKQVAQAAKMPSSKAAKASALHAIPTKKMSRRSAGAGFLGAKKKSAGKKSSPFGKKGSGKAPKVPKAPMFGKKSAKKDPPFPGAAPPLE